MDQQFLQRLHRRLGISQAELGRRLDISQSQVSRALNGRGRLNDETSEIAYKIAESNAPEIASEARLLARATKTFQESEQFRDLVRAALALIQKSA